MQSESKKSFNKHFKMFAQQVDLRLVKKSKGMILGIEEVLASEKVMRHTAKCSSATAEVYLISKHVRIKQDFNLRVMRPEFINAIKDNYSDNQEFLQKRFLSSCLTERAKIKLTGFDESKKRLIRKDSLAKVDVDYGPARILYNNRRTGSAEFGCVTERPKCKSICESYVSEGKTFMSGGIFKNTFVTDDF